MPSDKNGNFLEKEAYIMVTLEERHKEVEKEMNAHKLPWRT